MRVSSPQAVALLAAVAIFSVHCGGKTGVKQTAGGISPARSDAPVTAEVQISQYKFTPDTIRVAVGSVIRWTNHDNVGHTVTFTAADTGRRRPMRSRAEVMQMNRPSELYSSRLFSEGQTFTAKFDQPGRFAYICDPHPYMKAVVVVQ